MHQSQHAQAADPPPAPIGPASWGDVAWKIGDIMQEKSLEQPLPCAVQLTQLQFQELQDYALDTLLQAVIRMKGNLHLQYGSSFQLSPGVPLLPSPLLQQACSGASTQASAAWAQRAQHEYMQGVLPAQQRPHIIQEAIAAYLVTRVQMPVEAIYECPVAEGTPEELRAVWEAWEYHGHARWAKGSCTNIKLPAWLTTKAIGQGS